MPYKQRQNAMKRYFTYVDREKDYLQKPWIVTFKGEMTCRENGNVEECIFNKEI